VSEPESLLDVMADPDLLRKAYAAGITPDDLRQAILADAAPAEDDAERIRAAAQRIAEQDRESARAVADREQAFADAKQLGDIGKNWVKSRVQQYMNLYESEPEQAAALLSERNRNTGQLLIIDALEAAETGGIGAASLNFERSLNAILSADYKDALSAADKDALGKARYELATKGNAEPLLKVAFAAVSQHTAVKAEAKGEKKGEQKAEKTNASLALMTKLREAGAFAAPGTPKGTPPGKRYTWTEIQKMDKKQLDALPEGEFERAMNEG
jgi:hypothetical protein